MNFLNKETETPYVRRNKAKKKLKKLCKKRDKLDKNHRGENDYPEKRKEYNRLIAATISDINLAEEEIKLNAAAKKIDNRKTTTAIDISPKVTINSSTQKGVQISDSFKGCKKTNTPKKNKKKPKVKTILFLVAAVLVLAGVIALTVRITNCVNSKKYTQANACAILSTTSE